MVKTNRPQNSPNARSRGQEPGTGNRTNMTIATTAAADVSSTDEPTPR